MVANHWFRQTEKVLEAMNISSDAAKIRLAAFHLEGESQVWWDWIETSRDLEAITWVEFHGLFMSKYFLATTRHAKAQEFLELKQGMMTMMEYVARFTELSRFGDDYVAIDMAKVRRFENEYGLKLSIRGKIVGLCLQDMDSMVETTLAIEREMEDAQGIRDASAGGNRKEDQPSSSLGKRQRTYVPRASQVQVQPRPMTCFYYHQLGHMKRDFHKGMDPRVLGSAVPVISGTGVDLVCSFSPQCGPEGPVLVLGCYAGTLDYTYMPKRPVYGSRSRARLPSQYFRDPWACLRCGTTS